MLRQNNQKSFRKIVVSAFLAAGVSLLPACSNKNYQRENAIVSCVTHGDQGGFWSPYKTRDLFLLEGKEPVTAKISANRDYVTVDFPGLNFWITSSFGNEPRVDYQICLDPNKCQSQKVDWHIDWLLSGNLHMGDTHTDDVTTESNLRPTDKRSFEFVSNCVKGIMSNIPSN